eukprot:107775_1
MSPRFLLFTFQPWHRALSARIFSNKVSFFEPLFPHGHPFYIDCDRGLISHADNENIEYTTQTGYVRIKHPMINSDKSMLKSEIIYNHYHKKLELARHYKIIHLDGNLNNHKSCNLEKQVKSTYMDTITGKVLESYKITELSGFEPLHNYPQYLVNVQLGIILNPKTGYQPCGLCYGYVYVYAYLYDTTDRKLVQ